MGAGERGFLAKGSRRFMALPSGLAFSAALCSWLRLHGSEFGETPRGEFRVSNHFTNRATEGRFKSFGGSRLTGSDARAARPDTRKRAGNFLAKGKK